MVWIKVDGMPRGGANCFVHKEVDGMLRGVPVSIGLLGSAQPWEVCNLCKWVGQILTVFTQIRSDLNPKPFSEFASD